ncbi:uracil-DNA glycosylase [Paracoccus alkenifer]|uniref:Type-4 uracil-DNA glycosylase n=1 Tax=Paracoccus alkenifer TaxID=65735 RepID=A0A1H6N7S5_9RHOB|nr:uracil-DNA glycosylase [Paracoccus alkenifer]SEI08650.1 DNA polymerase [Paracoccus alkenifer]
MTAAPIWKDIEVDAATALALLDWQREMGADEPILDAPVDRYAEVAPAPAPPAPQPALPGMPAAPAAAAPAPQIDLPAQATAMAARAGSLSELASLMQDFDGLDIRRGARNFVFADGNPGARVMILGEAPGEEEDRQGRPFVGRAGQLLDQMFAAIGLSRQAVDAERALYITNVLPWRPPGNRRPEQAEIDAMLPFVARHVELAAPDFLVLMGNTPCQAVLGRQGILRLRGQWTQGFDRPVLPMTHPAYLLRNPIAKRDSWVDLLSLQARLQPGAQP